VIGIEDHDIVTVGLQTGMDMFNQFEKELVLHNRKKEPYGSGVVGLPDQHSGCAVGNIIQFFGDPEDLGPRAFPDIGTVVEDPGYRSDSHPGTGCDILDSDFSTHFHSLIFDQVRRRLYHKIENVSMTFFSNKKSLVGN
jgi:hypothetical protein